MDKKNKVGRGSPKGSKTRNKQRLTFNLLFVPLKGFTRLLGLVLQVVDGENPST
jgi:hypothetical protein